MALLAGTLPPGSRYATPQELLDLFAQNLSVPVSEASVFVTSTSAPTDVTKIWLDTSGANPVIKVYIGGAWTSISSSSNLTSGVTVTGGNVSLLSPMLFIASTGSFANRVGINTTTPAQTLDVDGTINSSAALTTAGTLSVTGAATLASTLAVTGNTTITGDLAVNGGDITSTSATANVFNVTSTTVNIGNAATTLSLGNTTGTTTVRNNAAVSGTLAVTGASTLTGNVTAVGNLSVNGSVTLGDANLDNVVFNADINSSFIPDTDDTFDLGSTAQRWRNAYVDGTGYIDSLVVTDNTISSSTSTGAAIITGGVGIAGALNVGLNTSIGGALNVTGATSLTGNLNVNTDKFTVAASTGNTVVAGTFSSAGAATFSSNASVTGNFSVTGTTTLGNVDALTLTNQTIETTAVAGPSPNTLPARPVGFLRVQINGTWRRIPFYADS